MNALTYSITLTQPVLAGNEGNGDPNTVETLNYISGSTVRGTLISCYQKAHTALDAADAEFRALFLNGKTRFLNAYPLSQGGKRSLPLPASWHKEKGTDGPIFDLAIKQPEGNLILAKADGGGAFCYLYEDEDDEAKVVKIEPAMQVNIHTARADRQQVTRNAQVYRYVALSAGQSLGGVIVSEDLTLLEIIKKLMEDHPALLLGKSRMGGYGEVRIGNIKIEKEWQEFGPLGDSEDLVITCLSDVILRNPDTGACSLTMDDLVGVKARKAFVKTRVLNGFNRQWNLPLPQMQVIAAGSVFVYDHTPELEGKFNSLIQAGSGERLAEGFGRLAINWQGWEDFEKFSFDVKDTRTKPVEISPSNLPIAKQMVQRMAMNMIDSHVIKAINAANCTRMPNRTQLSRIRSVILREAYKERDLTKITTALNDMRPTAKKQWDQFRINDSNFNRWVENFINDDQAIWKLLGIDLRNFPSLGNVEVDRKELTFETTIHYIEGVLHKAIEEAKK